MNSSVWLITGGTGAIGPGLTGELLGQGHRVRALARRAVSVGEAATFPEVFQGDICERDVIRRAVAGTEVVFHLAAKLHVPNFTEEMRAEYERVNVEGTKVLIEEAQAARVRRVVFFSTIAVYGDQRLGAGCQVAGDGADEEAVPHPETMYTETKLRAEEIVLSAKNSSGNPLGVVLRMAAVYGPRMKGNYVSLVRALERGRFLPVGDGANLRTLVYDRDAVRAAILAAEHPGAAGRVYNVSDGAVHSLQEIVAAICGALGRRPPQLYVPLPVARAAARMVDGAMVVAGRPPRFATAVEKLVESVAVRSDRIQRELGFRAEYDLERGWGETVEAWRAAARRGEGGSG